MRRVVLVISVLVLAALACNAPETTTAPPPESARPTEQPIIQQEPTPLPAERPTELSSEQIAHITHAAVQIVAARGAGDELEALWGGSGTIISPEGEILTNCHVACGAPVIVVLMTTEPDQPPEPSFIAEITHFDEEIDLAILQITTDMDGNPVSPTDLPYVEIGDSDSLRLADPIRIFGYPGVGGETITYTTGSVSGFESADVGGHSRRVIIKTDADIAGGNSGGTAVDLYGRLVGIPTWVNPDVREGVTIGGIGVLRPVNLVSYVRQVGEGTPPEPDAAALPPGEDPDPYEPNDDQDTAKGPLASGETIEGYISWEGDLDAFYITTSTTQPILATLTGIPSGTDYDLYLLDESGVLAYSESESPEEMIEFSPPSRGTYYVVVASYKGSSTTSPYSLTVTYDGSSKAAPSTGGIRVYGQAVDANTKKPLSGGVFGFLVPGVTCYEFFSAPELDLNLVTASAETDSKGFFTLVGVPTGATYSAFFIYGKDYICENKWQNIPPDMIELDLGLIEMSFE